MLSKINPLLGKEALGESFDGPVTCTEREEFSVASLGFKFKIEELGHFMASNMMSRRAQDANLVERGASDGKRADKGNMQRIEDQIQPACMFTASIYSF